MENLPVNRQLKFEFEQSENFASTPNPARIANRKFMDFLQLSEANNPDPDANSFLRLGSNKENVSRYLTQTAQSELDAAMMQEYITTEKKRSPQLDMDLSRFHPDIRQSGYRSILDLQNAPKIVNPSECFSQQKAQDEADEDYAVPVSKRVCAPGDLAQREPLAPRNCAAVLNRSSAPLQAGRQNEKYLQKFVRAAQSSQQRAEAEAKTGARRVPEPQTLAASVPGALGRTGAQEGYGGQTNGTARMHDKRPTEKRERELQRHARGEKKQPTLTLQPAQVVESCMQAEEEDARGADLQREPRSAAVRLSLEAQQRLLAKPARSQNGKKRSLQSMLGQQQAPQQQAPQQRANDFPERPSQQEVYALLKVWEENNFNNFNFWIQRSRSRLSQEWSESKTAHNKTIFHVNLTLKMDAQVVNRGGVAFHAFGQGVSKKVVKQMAYRKLVCDIVEAGYLRFGFRDRSCLDSLVRSSKPHTQSDAQIANKIKAKLARIAKKILAFLE